MSFKFQWPEFEPAVLEKAKNQLTTALNKGTKPDNLCDTIIVTDLNLGSIPPELELLELGELSLQKFRGIFKLVYRGDAYIELQTKVQANPLNHLSHDFSPVHPGIQAAQALVVPLRLRISEFNLRSIFVLVACQEEGVTLCFKNDPLESVLVTSSFDDQPSIRDMLQQEIEQQLRKALQNDVPNIIHTMSVALIKKRQLQQQQVALTDTQSGRGGNRLPRLRVPPTAHVADALRPHSAHPSATRLPSGPAFPAAPHSAHPLARPGDLLTAQDLPPRPASIPPQLLSDRAGPPSPNPEPRLADRHRSYSHHPAGLADAAPPPLPARGPSPPPAGRAVSAPPQQPVFWYGNASTALPLALDRTLSQPMHLDSIGLEGLLLSENSDHPALVREASLWADFPRLGPGSPAPSDARSWGDSPVPIRTVSSSPALPVAELGPGLLGGSVPPPRGPPRAAYLPHHALRPSSSLKTLKNSSFTMSPYIPTVGYTTFRPSQLDIVPVETARRPRMAHKIKWPSRLIHPDRPDDGHLDELTAVRGSSEETQDTVLEGDVGPAWGERWAEEAVDDMGDREAIDVDEDRGRWQMDHHLAQLDHPSESSLLLRSFSAIFGREGTPASDAAGPSVPP